MKSMKTDLKTQLASVTRGVRKHVKKCYLTFVEFEKKIL